MMKHAKGCFALTLVLFCLKRGSAFVYRLLPPPNRLCFRLRLSVCFFLSVSRIPRKLLAWFTWNLVERCRMGQVGANYILERIQSLTPPPLHVKFRLLVMSTTRSVKKQLYNVCGSRGSFWKFEKIKTWYHQGYLGLGLRQKVCVANWGFERSSRLGVSEGIMRDTILGCIMGNVGPSLIYTRT